MRDTADNYFSYWGKAKPQSNEQPSQQPYSQYSIQKSQQPSQQQYHLLVYHSLDVAAVGRLLLEQNLMATDRHIARLTNDKQAFIDLFTFVVALHDLGKFARGFQALRQFEGSPLVKPELGFSYTVRHDSLGFVLWRDKLSEVLMAGYSALERMDLQDSLDVLMQLVTGHHGQPPKVADGTLPIKAALHFTDEDIQAATDFMLQCRELLAPKLADFLFDEAALDTLKALSWVFAGVTMLADWQGSDADIFEYQQTAMDLSQYWSQHAQPKAQQKLNKDGYHSSVKLANFAGFSALFPGYTATPLQQYCADCPIDCGPQLILLEDITGAGKTEAALVMAQKLLSEGGAFHQREGVGLYIALPTMATSNAMFERMEKVYSQFFTGGKRPSLVLAHGARHLSTLFENMVKLSRQHNETHYQQDEMAASGWCNYWFADNRKKSLLADVGVGTVDQALLSILPAKHQAMRLLGVSGKVLIIDEIHSYAKYESKLIQALVKSHASLGGSTILLSATMPYLLRRELVKAFAAGAGIKLPNITTEATFPWVTQVGRQMGLVEQPVAPRQAVVRKVAIDYSSEEAAIWQRIEDALGQGKSVCWLRNTVNETIDCYEQAQSRLGSVAQGITLFHSRFCMEDRISIENDVLSRFGKYSNAAKRAGQLLIASPILDQSLDVDITVMISDIAPIDVLIQRVGRCCRHLRDEHENIIVNPTELSQDGRGQPTLYLYGPAFTEQPDKNWLRQFSSGTQGIYADTAKIWLTVKTLLAESAITMPQRARYLIEAVYGPAAADNAPPILQDIHDEVESKRLSEAFLANFNQLDMAKGYTVASNQSWCDDTQTPTRLADDAVDFILLKKNTQQTDKPLRFFADSPHYPLDMSKITLRKNQAAEAEPSVAADFSDAILALTTEFPLLQYYRIMVLIEQPDGGYQGQVLDDKQRLVTVQYDRQKGLQLCRA